MANTTNTQTNTTVNNRVFRIVERIGIPPAGTFSATLSGFAFLGEHTRKIKNDDKEEERTNEFVGLEYEFVDKNSGEIHKVMTECTLSCNPDSNFYEHILALNGGKPLEEGQAFDVLLGKSARIEIVHRKTTATNGVSREYANIKAVHVLADKAGSHQLSGKPVFYDVLTPNADAFNQLNRKHQFIIGKRNGATPDTAQAA